MRLLNTSTLKLEEFVARPPQYAILSHTWGDDEVLFDDFMTGVEQERAAWEKVKRCCELAASEGHQYAWIDTCCIHKTSSAELSEAINSMFSYYQSSTVCYVYLDIDINDRSEPSEQDLRECRWITRGWTLQELIAPRRVEFYTKSWVHCGSRRWLAPTLCQITKIDIGILERTEGYPVVVSNYSIAQRMSWAAGRVTTRPEDIAYCLLGLFDVHIPLLYGEGEAKAFFRLQQEIMKHSMDHSILAWGMARPRLQRAISEDAIASSPTSFCSEAPIIHFGTDDEPSEMTNKGLRITLPVVNNSKWGLIAVLRNCRFENEFNGPLGINIEPYDYSTSYEETTVFRRCGSTLFVVDSESFSDADLKTIYLGRRAVDPYPRASYGACFWFRFQYSSFIPKELQIFDLSAPSVGHWDQRTRVLRITETERCQTVTHLSLHSRPTNCRGSKLGPLDSLLKVILMRELSVMGSSHHRCGMDVLSFMGPTQHRCGLIGQDDGPLENAYDYGRRRTQVSKSCSFRAHGHKFSVRVDMPDSPKEIMGQSVYPVTLYIDKLPP